MRMLVVLLSLCLLAPLARAQDFAATNETYDISDAMINRSVTRTRYFLKDSLFALGEDSEAFLQKADRQKPVLIYLHGCNYGNRVAEEDLRKFYLGLGFYFARTDFITRGDTGPACRVVNGELVVRANMPPRLRARVLELNAHVDWLRKNGFSTVYVAGYSEGGMVIQLMQVKVEGAIIHAMACLPAGPSGRRPFPSKENRYLQLVSARDPFLQRQGADSCEGRPDHETFSYAGGNEPSHDPFSDPAWAGHIKRFLGVGQ